VAVVIRMKQMGRTHRPFYRICAADRRTPRDGRVIEELGTYDPSVADTNARCTLNAARVDYWLGVGAQPSDKVRVLIKKFGSNGTHLKEMEEARAKLSMPRIVPEAGEPVFVPKPPEEPAAEAEPSAEAAPEASAEATAEAVSEAPAADATAEAAPVEPAAEPAPAEGEAKTDNAETKAE
jgi:small subunit ribosomal protein S16